MRYRQLGNSSAFNTKMTNSSFLVEEGGKQLLVDCGYNVFTELKRLEELGELDLSKIDNIFITHTDDDHIGSLKAFLYYRYFVLGKTTEIYSGDYDGLCNYLNGVNSQVRDFRKVKAKIYDLKLGLPNVLFEGYNVITTDTHHYQSCKGIAFEKISGKDTLYISGDTKACEEIKDTIQHILDNGGRYRIFHDFSNFDDESKQVHACKSDTERVYSKEVLEAITWYHNDTEFNSDWQEL